MTRRMHRLAGLVLLTTAYVVAGKLGLALAFVHASATAVWPPTGIAIAAFVLVGRSVWPAIFIGAFLVNITTAGSILTSLGIAVGNTLEGALAGYLVVRFANGAAAFDRANDVFRFAALAAGLSTMVSPTIGVSSLELGQFARWEDYRAIWLTWWSGDAAGALIIAPLLILWFREPRIRWTARQELEAALLAGSTVLVGAAVFAGWFPAHNKNYPLAFLSLPLFLWAAFRFKAREGATTTFSLGIIAVWGTLRGFGPFARQSQNESLLILQAFLAVVSVMTLAVAAVVAERRRVELEVRRLNEELERRVIDRTAQFQTANEQLTREAGERRRTEQELEKNRERLLEAQQLAHIGSWEWDVAKNVVWWSEELYRLYGVEPATFAGSYEAFLERVHPDDRKVVDATVSAAFKDGQPFGFEHRIVRPDGTIRTVYGQGRVVQNEQGQSIRMLGTAQDITDRRRAEEQRGQLFKEQVARREAEQSNRLKDDFLTVLSHELRTPLNAILGWSQMLRRGRLGGPAAERAVEVIERNAQRQAQLIGEMLDVSGMITGKVKLNRQLIDLATVLQGTIDAVQPAAQAKQIDLAMKVDASLPFITADPARLQQVFMNLLSNAVKFTSAGGRVDVALRAGKDHVQLVVQDTGAGIAPDFLPHVFERFRQADASPTRTHGGLGLGLAIVRHLAELHGGSVRAESAGVGKGAIFSVTLPCGGRAAEAPSLTPPARVSEAGDETPSLQGLLVLVVDDDPDARELLTVILEKAGAEVVVAASASEASEILSVRRIDAMLVDIAMPDEDGYSFLRRVRSSDAGRSPVAAVALTAYAREQDAARALEEGFQDYVAKPASPGAILAAVARVARRPGAV